MEVFDRYKELLSYFWLADRVYSVDKRYLEGAKEASDERTEEEFSRTKQELSKEEKRELEKAYADEKCTIDVTKRNMNIISMRVHGIVRALNSINLEHFLNLLPGRNGRIKNESASLARLDLLVDRTYQATDLVEKEIKEYKELIAKEKMEAQQIERTTVLEIEKIPPLPKAEEISVLRIENVPPPPPKVEEESVQIFEPMAPPTPEGPVPLRIEKKRSHKFSDLLLVIAFVLILVFWLLL